MRALSLLIITLVCMTGAARAADSATGGAAAAAEEGARSAQTRGKVTFYPLSPTRQGSALTRENNTYFAAGKRSLRVTPRGNIYIGNGPWTRSATKSGNQIYFRGKRGPASMNMNGKGLARRN
jgi:hypothetical protein